MAAAVYLADVPTYAALIAVYPTNGAALLALPAGTRVYIENQQREVVRGPTGKTWVPVRMGRGPRLTGTTAKWVGMPGISAYTNSTGVTRGNFRAGLYEMPGGRESTIDSISFGSNTSAPAVGAGTDEFDVRLYEAYPDGSPIVGKAPLNVWKFNAAGSGGAGVCSLAGLGVGNTRISCDLPGGAVVVPARFWLGVIHNLGTAPSLSSPSLAGGDVGLYPSALVGSYPDTVLTPNRMYGMGWAESTPAAAPAWAAGATTVWDAAADWTAVVWGAHLRVTA